MRYNEKELRNGAVIYSSQSSPGAYPCWGLYDKKTGESLVDPVYNRIEASGTMNGHPVVFLAKGHSKKIYLVDKRKLLFDDYDLIGKEWENIPELHSNNFGDIYYVFSKDSKFCLVDESGKRLVEQDSPFVGKIKLFDHGSKSYAITSKGIYELGNGKPFDGLSPATISQVVDAFTIKDSLFFILKSGGSALVCLIYSFSTKQVVENYFTYERKDHYKLTSHGLFYLNSGDEINRLNADGTKDTFDFNGAFNIIEINDRAITGIQKDNKTYDIETGEVVMTGVAFERIPKTDILVTLSTKGAYRGLKEYKTNRVLAPAIFDNIYFGSLIACELGNKDYKFDQSSKSFDQPSSRKLVRNTFSTISWKDKTWE